MTVFNRSIIILSLLTSSLLSIGQGNPHLVPDLDFVVYDSNYIHFYNDSSNFDTFYGKLDKLIFEGEGKVRVMQIGGSHIQADIWSDQMRRHFYELSPNMNGGRGFLFPYRVAHTNNPYYYRMKTKAEWEGHRNSVIKHQATWGVSGITATTKDSMANLRFYFRGDDVPYYDFNSVKIFHDIDSNYCIDLISDTAESISINREIGYTEFKFDHFIDTFEVNIYREDTVPSQFNLYGVSVDNDDPGVIYTSIGVNGASTKSYLRCQKFSQHLAAIPPDLVIFCIGINDAYNPDFCGNCYEDNYDRLIDSIKTVNPNCDFLFVTNNDSYYKRRYPNRRVEEARDAMIRLAKKHKGGLWDMYHVMGGLGSIKTWQNHGYAKRDKIHLTGKGYKLMGDLMFSALMKKYSEYLQRADSE